MPLSNPLNYPYQYTNCNCSLPFAYRTFCTYLNINPNCAGLNGRFPLATIAPNGQLCNVPCNSPSSNSASIVVPLASCVPHFPGVNSTRRWNIFSSTNTNEILPLLCPPFPCIEPCDDEIFPSKIVKAQKQYRIFPSPANNFITVINSHTSDLLVLQDLQGRIVKMIHLLVDEEQIDISSLKPGFYTIRIENQADLKFVKN